MIRFLILSVMMSLVAFYSLTRMAWNVMSNAVVLLGQNY